MKTAAAFLCRNCNGDPTIYGEGNSYEEAMTAAEREHTSRNPACSGDRHSPFVTVRPSAIDPGGPLMPGLQTVMERRYHNGDL